MPKMKTRKSAAKRFKISGTKKLLSRKAQRSHLLEGKSAKRRRRLAQESVVGNSDRKRIKTLLPYLNKYK